MNVNDLMAAWTNEPGYGVIPTPKYSFQKRFPLISFVDTPTGYTIKQEPFTKGNHSIMWFVPIHYTVAGQSLLFELNTVRLKHYFHYSSVY